MSQRKFEYSDAKSFKFWNVDIEGTCVVTQYGRIGTDGQTTSKECGTAADAQKLYDKLVAEKTKKGYVEVAGGADAAEPGEEGAAADGLLAETMFLTTRNISNSEIENLTTFIGKRVADFTSGKSIKAGSNHVFRVRVDWDTEIEFLTLLEEFLATDAALAATGFIIGQWKAEPDPVDAVVNALVQHKDRLPLLQALFVGDISREENEISWIEQSDLSPLLKAFPKLELLRVRGGNGLSFSDPQHKTLRALGIEAGGLGAKVVAQLCKAKFPNLEFLELWLGTDSYGGDCQVNDLQPILAGKLFPKLKYLGLRNSEIVDDIAGVIVNSPVIRQIETLDLSLGTLTDEGGNALLNLPQDANLKRLDLHRHFLSNDMMKKLNKLPFTVNVAERQDDEDSDGHRFVAIGE